MPDFANTPAPPYYAVIFTAVGTPNRQGYADMVQQMRAKAEQQPGYLGMESAGEALEITVSYWQSLDAIRAWKSNIDHLRAQDLGRSQWYAHYQTRIARVERDYAFDAPNA